MRARLLAVPALVAGFVGMVSAARCQADASQRPSPAVAVVVPVDVRPVRYSRHIFGGFVEHFHRQVYGGIFDSDSPLADENGFRRDVIRALRELKLAIVRWPGGCFASGYHWRDGVGPQRKPVPDPVWGVVEPNRFGTDEFVRWCRAIGAEPYICTNAGNGSPEEMRDWVAYCNATRGRFAALRASYGNKAPHRVRFWSIGNENYGEWEIGQKSPAEWGPFVRRCAELMRSVDPSIKLAAPALISEHWDLPLLRAAGELLDYVAVHRYWLGLWQENKEVRYEQCLDLFDGPEEAITRMIAILRKAGYLGKVKIAFDEWNLRGWHHPGFPRKKPVAPDDRAAARLIARRDLNAVPSQYTMADAIFTASFLNAALRHSAVVDITCIAPIVNTRGPLYVHPKGILKRTTYHVLAMYANELYEYAVSPRISVPEDARWMKRHLDAIATVDRQENHWAIVLVNRHPSVRMICRVQLGRSRLDGPYPAVLLTADSPDAYNDLEHPDRVRPRRTKQLFRDGQTELPPHSIVIVKYSAAAR